MGGTRSGELPPGLRLRSARAATEPMTEDTIFDTASLTKVTATKPAVALMVERGQVKLGAPVKDKPGS